MSSSRLSSRRRNMQFGAWWLLAVMAACLVPGHSFSIRVAGANEADETSVDSTSLQEKLNYCQATCSGTKVRENILQEQVDGLKQQLAQLQQSMEEQTCPPMTDSEKTTEQLATLESTVSDLRIALQDAEGKLLRMSVERNEMQTTVEEMTTSLAMQKEAVDEARQLKEEQEQVASQHKQVVSEMNLLLERLRELEEQHETVQSQRSDAVETARQLGMQEARQNNMKQVHFWIEQYNRQTTALDQVMQQKTTAEATLHAVKEELFLVRREWHQWLERDRSIVLRRQLRIQNYIVEPWETLCAVAIAPVWVWLTNVPPVVTIQKEWGMFVQERLPTWNRSLVQGIDNAWKTVGEPYAASLYPPVTAAWLATEQHRQQARNMYETVIRPSPVVQAVVTVHDTVTRFVGDVLVIIIHMVFPESAAASTAGSTHVKGSAAVPQSAFVQMLQLVQDNPQQTIVVAYCTTIFVLLFLGLMRWRRSSLLRRQQGKTKQ